MKDDVTTASTDFSREDLREMMARWLEPQRIPQRFKIITDTSNFFCVEYDDVVILGGKPYLCRNTEREGRFGIDDEPKFWVRRALDLTDGSAKIIKMVFHERFSANVGGLTFECVRSPKKEARILDLVRGHPSFMQGFSVPDEKGNIVRIIDFIAGERMANTVLKLGTTHEDYFHSYFPAVLDEFMELVRAIRFLHERDEKHGDIRRDHIIRDKRTNTCRWIDFDFNYLHKESMFGYDLFGLGNILVYLTGRGDVSPQMVAESYPAVFGRLDAGDVNVIFNNRVVNLRKVYPYIPDALNYVMMHFSRAANVYYETTDQMLSDLEEVRSALA